MKRSCVNPEQDGCKHPENITERDGKRTDGGGGSKKPHLEALFIGQRFHGDKRCHSLPFLRQLVTSTVLQPFIVKRKYDIFLFFFYKCPNLLQHFQISFHYIVQVRNVLLLLIPGSNNLTQTPYFSESFFYHLVFLYLNYPQSFNQQNHLQS